MGERETPEKFERRSRSIFAALVGTGDKDAHHPSTRSPNPPTIPADAASTNQALQTLAEKGIKITINGKEVIPDSRVAEENKRLEESVRRKKRNRGIRF